MKILHCCLANYFIDNFGYQENILTKMHKEQGHKVRIVASTETFIDNTKLGYVNPSSYLTPEGIPITRIPYIKYLPHSISRKLRIYKGLSQVLNEFNPDIIFLHDVQFIGIKEIIKYVKKNDVKVFADSHTDDMNSAKTWISRNILHRIIYKTCTQAIEPYVLRFWGVTPSRKDFLENFYGVSPCKTGLLVMGVDDSEVEFGRKNEIKAKQRRSLNIATGDFVVITGGKIVKRKNIHMLMEAVKNLSNANIKLIVFGSVSDEMAEEIKSLSQSPSIYFVGWKNSSEINELFFASDLAIFPGAHSVLWEQAVGLGLPAIFQRWKGYEHIDLKGNCTFLDTVDVKTIEIALLEIYSDPIKFSNMKRIAETKGIAEFSYSKIAKRAISE